LYAGTSNTLHTRATLVTAILSLVGSLAVCLLSWLEHSRAFKPSFVLLNYLLLSVLLGLARTRTLWKLKFSPIIPAIFTSTLVLRALLLVFECFEKRHLLSPRYRNCSKELTRGAVSNAVFWWLNPLFFKGYKQTLVLQDLYPLEETLLSKPLHEALADAWEKGQSLPALEYSWPPPQN
jgi:ATP-binding cassette subfamily C (CFTR/MRP) protein 1